MKQGWLLLMLFVPLGYRRDHEICHNPGLALGEQRSYCNCSYTLPLARLTPHPSPTCPLLIKVCQTELTSHVVLTIFQPRATNFEIGTSIKICLFTPNVQPVLFYGAETWLTTTTSTKTIQTYINQWGARMAR